MYTRSTVSLLEFLHNDNFVRFQKQHFFFLAECAGDSGTPVPYDNRLKVFLHGGASNSAPVLFNISAEITHRVACCCSSNMEIVCENFCPAAALI